jgi:hypothetical protein
VPYYREALELILDVEPDEESMSKIPDVSIIEPHAEMLYGLIHQRYILTKQGLQQMVLIKNTNQKRTSYVSTHSHHLFVAREI